jgi:hypothetical protein
MGFIFHFIRGPLMYPSQRGSDLREDINTMVKFWRLLFTDKKYMTVDKAVPFGGRLYGKAVLCGC